MHILKSGQKGIAWVISAVGAFMMFGIYIGGVALHLYTILVAFRFSGFLSAGLALVLPFLAEAYWFLAFWWKTGTVFNSYSFYVLLYLGWLAIGLGLAWLGSSITPRESTVDDEQTRSG